ncbi:MAG TPA: hypothetical protein VJH97_06960 [Candidatus Nanoarchaeia archaeon]|nr:hypothetical protein [Candidatus Nanoarchaeia archaeon]
MAGTTEHAPRLPQMSLPNFREVTRWARNHWQPVGLALATAAGGAYLAFAQDRGPQSLPPEPNRASDTIKPPEGGGSEIPSVGIVPNLPTAEAGENKLPVEAPPSIAVSPQPQESSSNPEIPPFDCGILSPEACASGDKIQWNRPDGKPMIGMGFKLKPSEQLRIPQKLVVAGYELKQPHTYTGYTIQAISRDGKTEINYLGSINSINLTNTGKEFTGDTPIGEIDASGRKVFKEADYNLIVWFSDEGEIGKYFPQQALKPPLIVNNGQVSSQPQLGMTFWDVQPPRR